ncbi:MAG: cyclic nucleotide-binding domain-containing protein [Thermoflexales bacterium]|nr:cyclic nucleotide-binding domain-containing protein [Thermoflexales bacterium]
MTTSTLPERIEFLQRAFPELPAPVLTELAQQVRERTYPIGTVLCTEEKVEETFYILCSGKVAVSKFLDGETSRILTYHGPGEFFGELALIRDTRRAATVVTIEESTVFELDKKNFMALLESNPMLVVTIMRAVASRLREADQRSIADLRRKNKELGLAYRGLEAETQQRSQFLTLIAHQLRAPLGSVKNSLNLIDSGGLGQDKMGQMVDAVTENVDAIVQLVNNILFLQEIDLVEPQFQPVDIQAVVGQAVHDIQPSAERVGLSIQVEATDQTESITGNASSLKQAVTALLENALRSSPRGGEIRVTVRPHNQAVEISVQDSGENISPQAIEQIFDRVQRQEAGRPLHGGGLGLPIAKAVVEQHKGSIHVTSQTGQGNCFTIYLPSAQS